MIVNTENTDLLVQQTQSTEQDVNEKKVDNQLQKSIKAEKKDPTDPPKKKLDKSKAKQWVIDLYNSNGGEISDSNATLFAENKNIKNLIHRHYRYNALDVPEEKDLNTLYSSWEIDIDPVDEILQNSTIINPEKKNPQTTSTQSTDSDSSLDDGGFSSEYEGFFNADKVYQENVKNIPRNILSMSSSDAALTLNSQLGQYGITVTDGSDESETPGITITRPDKETMSVSMFSDVYKGILKVVNPGQDPEELQSQRHSEIIDFIQGSVNDNLSFMHNVFLKTDSEGIPEAINNNIMHSLTPDNEDISFIIGMLPGQKKSIGDYFNIDGSFKYELWKSDVGRADAGLSKHKLDQIRDDEYEKVNTKAKDNTALKKPKMITFPNLDPSAKINQEVKSRDRKKALKKISDISRSFNLKKEVASANIGNALRTSGAYKKIDVNNPVSISEIRQAGLLPGDLPMDQILINGAPSTVNEISSMMYDYQKIKEIRAGKIKIEIGDPKTAGVLADQVAQIKDLIRTQEAYDNEGVLGYDNGFTDWLNQAQETVEGGLTAVGLSAWELASNVSYIGYDSLVAMGVSKAEAQMIMYGNIGLPGIANMGRLLDPELVKYVKNEYQPVYEGDILDSSSFGEAVYKTSTAAANSMVYTGLFMLNPAVGLTATGLGSYGGDRVYQNQRVNEINEKKEMGFSLSPEEQEMLNQSGFMSRLNSLSKAGIEVGITSLFTYRYFKGVKSASNFKGPKTAENAKKIADQYANNVRQTIAGKVSAFMGIDKKAVLAELPEENLIALTNYYVDIAFGLDVWDFDKAKKMVAETSIVSVFSGASTGMIVKASQNSRIKKAGEQQIKNNINLPAENEAIVNKLNIDAQVNQLEKKAEQGLIDLENVNGYQDLKDLQLQADNQVNKFEDMKNDLVKRMNVSEKSKFLDIIRQIEQQDRNISSDETSNNVKKKSEKNIVNLKKDAREILSKYPSDMSFYFADAQVKSEYITKAMEVMGKEKTEKGENNFTLNSDDPAVFDRAAKLHTQAVADGIVEARQNANAAQDIGLNNSKDFLIEVDRQELNDWNLSNDILTVKDMLSAPELDLTVTKPVEDVDGSKDSEIKVTKEGDVVVATTKLEKTQKQINQERTGDIVSRIEYLNTDSDLTQDLHPKQYETLKNFFDDVKAGRKVSYGKIEAILDAQDIAIQIRSNSFGKIKVGSNLKGVLKEDGSLTEKGIKLYNSLAQGIMAKTKLNTMTMEGLTLIRDTQIGAPLHNLIQEGMRSSAEAQQKAGQIKTQHTSLYEAEVIAYNKANGTTYKTDPRESVDSSYEMSILSMLKRKTGAQTMDGQDVEFARAKKLILEELAERKKDAEASYNPLQIANGDKVSAIAKYKKYKDVIDKLGVSDATSFEDVSSKALPFNLNAINRLSESMPGKKAIQRINDYESHEAVVFEEGSYTPIFMSKASDGIAFNDYFGPANKDGIPVNSGKKVTRPPSLGTHLRLNPAFYWDNAYAQLNGMEMEIASKKSYETLDNLLNNKTFLESFEDGIIKDALISNFKNRSKMWNKEVRNSNLEVKDIGDNSIKDTGRKLANAWFGINSAISLARITQPMSQFMSATTGSYPLLKNKQAKDFMKKRGVSFFGGLAGSFNMNNKVGKVWNKVVNFTSAGTMDFFDSKGKLGNIYSKSRTGLRNALSSQLAIDPNQSMPAEYYVNTLNMSDEDGRMLKAAGARLTLDRVLEFINSSNEMSLNFMLANSDKAAANIAFEAHYLDYRISKGETVTDLSEFWEKENANPDLEAIRYADQLIDRTMRQSDATGESQIYDSETGKNAMRIAMPFQKFIMNAKADFSNQIAILQDPSISELQKQDARRAVKGKMNEIISFNAIKYAGSLATLKGLSGLLGMAIDEDDIFESGGMDGFIQTGLPIKSDKNLSSLTAVANEATSLEELNAAQAGFVELQNARKGFETYALNYDKKFSSGDTYGVVGQTIQDAIQTLDPSPKLGFMNDMLAWSVNKVYGEDIAREFSSRDLTQEPFDTDTALEFFLKKGGMLGISYETISRGVSAFRLRYKGTFVINQGDYKNKEVYLTAPTDEMRQQLANEVDFLFQLRCHALMSPVAPRADLDKYADRLERTIEKYFTRSTPDQRMQRIMGMQGPLQEED
tara:strand:+ start:52 stop:6465 length:6414 start_codon:yes stop_codon:yes gene_type:complete